MQSGSLAFPIKKSICVAKGIVQGSAKSKQPWTYLRREPSIYTLTREQHQTLLSE